MSVNTVPINAQTSNIVLFAVHAAAGNYTPAVRHLPPIFAFILGCVGVTWLHARRDLTAAQLRILGATVELVTLLLLFALRFRVPVPS